MKYVVANKSILAEYATITLTEELSSRIFNRLTTMFKDPRSLTLHIKIDKGVEARVLYFGAYIILCLLPCFSI